MFQRSELPPPDLAILSIDDDDLPPPPPALMQSSIVQQIPSPPENAMQFVPSSEAQSVSSIVLFERNEFSCFSREKYCIIVSKQAFT